MPQLPEAPHTPIQILGARIHNLQNISLDIPRNQITWLTGVSGSGKSSLAFDTLHVEGQRRFLSGISSYARQFLERLARPDVDDILNLPLTIALRQNAARSAFPKHTFARAANLHLPLASLYAQAGAYQSDSPGKLLRKDSPDSLTRTLQQLPQDTTCYIAVPWQSKAQNPASSDVEQNEQTLEHWLAHGITRAIADHQTRHLNRDRSQLLFQPPQYALIDRLRIGQAHNSRWLESLESAFTLGHGSIAIFIQPTNVTDSNWTPYPIDNTDWALQSFHEHWFDPATSTQLPDLSIDRLLPTTPLGACPACQGNGIVANSNKSNPCDACQGSGLNTTARRVVIAGRSIANWMSLTIEESLQLLRDWRNPAPNPDASSQPPTPQLIDQFQSQLDNLHALGLGYLHLNRPFATLSTGEARRTLLASLLATPTVHALYILDEPMSGLHPADRPAVIQQLKTLYESRNTLLIVDHDPNFQHHAHWIIDLGAQAGHAGGNLDYVGPASSFPKSIPRTDPARPASEPNPLQSPILTPPGPSLHLDNANTNNLNNLSVDFPLNQLVVVSGPSGSGKSSLVIETLLPALQSHLDPQSNSPHQSLTGADQLHEVLFVDQAPIPRSERSIPATYLGIFDTLRKTFADAPEAKLRNYSPKDFSFNSSNGGRCHHCHGLGRLKIDMQFLPNVDVTCPICHGRRFRKEILEIQVRGKNIAQLLDMTVAEAFQTLRGHHKTLRQLAPLKDVGLGYLPLGQPLSTLSGGELQRLKIAAFLGKKTSKRTLFLFDEPTLGLHTSDIEVLTKNFKSLLTLGHSIIAIDHSPAFIATADWIIDLGPAAGPNGGHLTAAGPPAHIRQTPTSPTASYI